MPSQPIAPHIRSFHARRGRRSVRASDQIERLWPHYGVTVDGRLIDLGIAFGPGLPVVLEIGFGLGEATAAMAAADPGTGILAVDVHTPGIARLIERVEAAGLENVRVAHGDAVELVRDQLANESLAGIRVFFPDPWPKRRHNKRRIIRPEIVALLVSRLRPGGFVHVATDWSDYAEQIANVLDAEPLLSNDSDGRATRRAERPVTNFESAGLALGHRVTDLVYRRR